MKPASPFSPLSARALLRLAQRRADSLRRRGVVPGGLAALSCRCSVPGVALPCHACRAWDATLRAIEFRARFARHSSPEVHHAG